MYYNSMKKIIIVLFVVSLSFSLSSAEPEKYKLGILDVMSSSFSESEIKMFTDVLRTELYKLDHFSIVERGVIINNMKEFNIENSNIDDSKILELGQNLNVDKLLICSLNNYSNTTVMNIRIIDVNTSYLDYTENIFLSENGQIFDAIRDLVLKIELKFIENNSGDTISYKDKLNETWKLLGATEEVSIELTRRKIDPSMYLDMRQYDITFTPDNYYTFIAAGIKDETLLLFFKEGIPNVQIQKAISHGIVDLDNYKNNFKRNHLTFNDYLDAYERQILKAEDYIEYKKGFKKYQFFAGAGGVSNAFPIMTSEFSFFILTMGAEYYITDYQRDFNKISTEAGLKLMQGFVPSPYFQVNAYIGQFPFYLKGAIGAYAEVFLGGHVGVYGKIGMEISSNFEFDFMTTFAGNQPEISYGDMETEKGDPDYDEIIFPYFAATLLYKF